MFYDYEDEDFYTENEYQEEIDNLKEAIRKSVKSEIVEEMNRLREENKKLQGIKENFDAVKRDFENKKSECERITRNAKYNAEHTRLAELMEHAKVLMWSVTWKYCYKEKCDKCDSWRKIKVVLPSGKVATDECECSKHVPVYYPQENILYELADRNHDFRVWYKKRGDKGDEYFIADTIAAVPSEIIDHNKKFEEIDEENKYHIYFTSFDECKKILRLFEC